MKWLKESNRPRHVLYGFIGSLIGTLLFAVGLAIGKEYGDKAWGGQFDRLDLCATLIGGIAGQIVQLFIIWRISLWQKNITKTEILSLKHYRYM